MPLNVKRKRPDPRKKIHRPIAAIEEAVNAIPEGAKGKPRKRRTVNSVLGRKRKRPDPRQSHRPKTLKPLIESIEDDPLRDDFPEGLLDDSENRDDEDDAQDDGQD